MSPHRMSALLRFLLYFPLLAFLLQLLTNSLRPPFFAAAIHPNENQNPHQHYAPPPSVGVGGRGASYAHPPPHLAPQNSGGSHNNWSGPTRSNIRAPCKRERKFFNPSNERLKSGPESRPNKNE
ncbi:hypothetical protein K438DRAFT_1929725 [Mycena galopus ATCC 62051]|nr:hypothetical protein K438DRAFT_1929725 [Mycena galopus ATCC 62051]